MHIKQYYLGCLSHASYLILDGKSKTAVVVDPQRDVDQYLEDSAAADCQIQYVFLTHFHNDFLAGHIELRDRAGAKICLGEKAQAEFDAVKLKDGEAFEFGDVRLKILETPGHTLEGISILVYDLATNAEKPQAVLTGDTLFIGDVGRPDLLASSGVSADELADMLYDSLTKKLLTLPDGTLVYPAHGAGSMCAKNLSKETVSTIGDQKKFNYALQPMSREQFKQIVTAEQPEAPSYFLHDAIRNRQERSNLHDTLMDSMETLSLAEVLKLQSEGAQIVDVRGPADFEGAHMKGSINIGLMGKYDTWCGTVLDSERPIVIISDEGDEEESIIRLGRIGFDNVVGYLVHGMHSLDRHPEWIASIERVTAVAVSERIGSGNAPFILDVRNESEWACGHLPNSLNIPLNHLTDRIAELPENRPLVVHCESGYRSSIACSLLAKLGRASQDMIGGFKAWEASNLPIIVEQAARTSSRCDG